MEQQVIPLKVFYSYAHKDESLREQLEKHLSDLRQSGFIAEWHDRRIVAGTDWMHDVNSHLETASLILLLVSADFMASDYCYGIEMKRAMERHTAGDAVVIPIVLRPVAYERAPFANLQMLPTNAKPLTTWSNRDEAFLDVAQGIRKAIESLNGREQQVLDSSFTSNPTTSKAPSSVPTVEEPFILDIGAINPPSDSIGNAEIRFSLTNLTGKIVKVTSISLEIIKYDASTAFISSTVAGPINEFFLYASVKPPVPNYELLTRHHELGRKTEGFFLKIDATEGYVYSFRLKATWHILGKEKNITLSPLFEVHFPVKSAEGLLRLAESLSQSPES